ncbi:MAG: molybdate ABC transporter substrate-binding protein [Planctomycetota bacterium]|nr:MAG: molybdate ABC transporter substrate-binding protein [Planctomycetota bacterium]
MRASYLFLCCCLPPLIGCGAPGSSRQDSGRPVALFAAASTKEAVERIARDFEAQTGVPVEVTLGPSSGLAKQIERGARADLFLSADEASADYLADKKLVALRRDLLSNRLVVVVPTKEVAPMPIKELADLADPRVERIAMAEAKEALRQAGLLGKVQSKFVGGVDVRATLQYVALGEAAAGFVYYTDAQGSSRVRVAFEVKPQLHAPIRYPLVLIGGRQVTDSARSFYQYLASGKAAQVFRDAHFGIVP